MIIKIFVFFLVIGSLCLILAIFVGLAIFLYKYFKALNEMYKTQDEQLKRESDRADRLLAESDKEVEEMFKRWNLEGKK